MPICIGSYQPGDNIGSPFGDGAAVLQKPVPNITSTTGPCAEGELAVYTAQEVDHNTASPFVMSVADGAALSGLIIAVWACALYGRALIRSLFSDAGSTS